MEAAKQLTYEKPPIIEAVVEFRFSPELSETELRRLSKAFSNSYPEVDEQLDYTIKYDIATEAVDKDQKKNLIRSTSDQSRGLLIKRDGISCSVRAPYSGYDLFREDIVQCWKTVHSTLGFRKLERVGMRYINRVDLLMVNNLVDYERYLNLRINLPEEFPPISSYQMGFTFNVPEILSESRISSSVQHGVVLNHASFFLDIDIGRTFDLPQREDKIFDIVDTMRTEKNRLFETFITDEARELFNAK